MTHDRTNNVAYIDGQNLHLGTIEEGWAIDFMKFRIYLKEKYNIQKVYYFLGYGNNKNNGLYTKLKKAGYTIKFKEQSLEMKSQKKGNIDSDMIFHIMEQLLEEPDKFDKIVLVTGDGDFKILIDYLVKKGRLEKILFPNKRFTSSLYKSVPLKWKDYLLNIKQRIEYKKREAS